MKHLNLTHPYRWISRPLTNQALRCLAVATLLLGCGPLPAETPRAEVDLAGSRVPPCLADNDGIITASEFPFAAAVPARFSIASGSLPIHETIIRGEPSSDPGGRRWDFSDLSELPFQPVVLEAHPLSDQWFASSFETASLAAPLSADGSLLGALAVSAEQVSLLGTASRDEDDPAGKTLLVYENPIPLYRFPVEVGQAYNHTSEAHQVLLNGIPTALEDTYSIEVSARGTLVLPQLVLENTLRITVRLNRVLLVGSAEQVSHIFVHECIGEVARIVSIPSQTHPIDTVFGTAQEIRRLSL